MNGEEIYLEEVMALQDRLPADLLQQPMETYFDNLWMILLIHVWLLRGQ